MRDLSGPEPQGPALTVRSESGLSLVEVMVALLLLGVILSAAAASMLAFTREASASERRVQATAAMTRLHEDFQSIPFPRTANYDVDLLELEAVDGVEGFEELDLLASPPSFEGRPIRSLPLTDERDPRVPVAYRIGPLNELLDTEVESLEDGDELEWTLGDREIYEVVQVVTEVDRSGDGLEEVRRLTTFVAWEWLGRRYVQRLDSERAITSFEPDADPQTRGFLIAPLRVVLDDDSRLVEPLSLIASFTAPVDSAVVHFERLELDENDDLQPIADEVELTGTVAEGGGYLRFSGAIPTSAASGAPMQFDSDGDDPLLMLRLVGTTHGDSEEVGALANVRLSVGVEQEVAVTAANAAPSPVAISELGLLCPIVIDAQVEGMHADDYAVQATWTAGEEQRTIALAPVNGSESLNGGLAPFRGTLGVNDSHGLSVGDKVRFTVRAEGYEGQDDLLETSSDISIVAEGAGC